MRVNYNPALVGLVQQVRQISVMGYNVPMHIQDAAELAKQFMKQARALQQASEFFYIFYFYLLLFWDLICISSQKFASAASRGRQVNIVYIFSFIENATCH